MTGVNRTTVIRVYEELWAQGYTESTPGSFTTVRKRKPVVFMKAEDDDDSRMKQDIYRDHLDLQYDLMMHHLENGDTIEKGKINFLQLSTDTRLLDRKRVKACMRDVLNETKTDPVIFVPVFIFRPKSVILYKAIHFCLTCLSTKDNLPNLQNCAR